MVIISTIKENNLGILSLISSLFSLYSFLIIAYCLLSWFPGAYQTQLSQLLIKVCQPYLRLFDFIPPIAGIRAFPVRISDRSTAPPTPKDRAPAPFLPARKPTP